MLSLADLTEIKVNVTKFRFKWKHLYLQKTFSHLDSFVCVFLAGKLRPAIAEKLKFCERKFTKMGVKVSLLVLIWTNMCWRQILSTTGSSVTFQFDSINNQFWKAGEEDPDPFDPGEDIKVPTPGNPEHHSRVNFTFEDCDRGIYKGYAVNNDYFPFKNIKNGRMREVVRFLAKSDAHIFLAPVDKDVKAGSYYSIAIGGTFNRRTDIRKHFVDRMEKEVAAISTPNILTTDHYRGFIIDYNTVTGDLALFPELSPYPILRWRDPDPMDIKFYSFSGFASTIVYAAYNCTGTDAHSVISLEEAFATSTLQGDANTADGMRTKLLENYDAKMPPPRTDGQPIKVNVGFTLNYFTLDMEEQVFIANAWVRMSWTDSRLAYNATTLTDWVLRFGPDEIWKPDLTLYNNAYPTDIEHYADTHVIVYANGSVLWVPPARVAAHCSLSMTLWPHDKHTCQLKFGSWTHHGQEVDLEFWSYSNETTDNGTYTLQPYSYVENSEWTLIETSVDRNAMFYPCCPEPWIDLTFSITFKRNSPSYAAIFLTSITFICVVYMLGMMLPPTHGGKLTIGLAQFFILCMFLLYFESKIPALGDHLPLIVVVYLANLGMVTSSLIIAVIVLNLSRTRKAYSPPQCCRCFLANPSYVKYLCLSHMLPFVPKSDNNPLSYMGPTRGQQPERQQIGPYEAELNGISLEPEVSNTEDSATLVDIDTTVRSPMLNAEWILLACIIDRIAFFTCAVTSFALLLPCYV